jgi:hypothetical protein
MHAGRHQAFLVNTMTEKKRVIPIRQAGASREAELLAQGWVRQTTIGEPRLSELVQTYRGLGYDVEVIEHRTEGDGCNTCFEADKELGRVYGDIYLRKSAVSKKEEDDLF